MRADMAILGPRPSARQTQQTARRRTYGPIWTRYPCPTGSVHLRREVPLAGVPGERIAIGRRLDAVEPAGRNFDEELLIQRDPRQGFGPEPLQLDVERALVRPLRCGRGGVEQYVEPWSNETPVTVRRELWVVGGLGHESEVELAARQRIEYVRGGPLEYGRGDADRGEVTSETSTRIDTRLRTGRDLQRHRQALGTS